MGDEQRKSIEEILRQGFHEDQYLWRDTEGHSFILHRKWPNDIEEWKNIEGRFLDKAMDVTKAELVCVGQPPVELSLEEAQILGIEIGWAAWDGAAIDVRDEFAAWDEHGNPLGAINEETMRAMTFTEGELSFESAPIVVNPEDNPMKRACDKDRSIPMG